jgi:hypothetical protein
MLATLYLTLKLIHVFAALALFAVEGVGAVALPQARRAKDFAALGAALAPLKAIGPLGKIAPPLLLLTGLALMATTWGFQIAWADLALGIFLLVFVGSKRLDPPWQAALSREMAAGQGPLTPGVRALLEDRGYSVWLALRSGLAMGLVFLMTVKPGLLLGVLGLAAMAALRVYLELRPKARQALAPKTAS